MRWCHKGCLGLAPLRMSYLERGSSRGEVSSWFYALSSLPANMLIECLGCSRNICNIELKLISGISFLFWCEVHPEHQTENEKKMKLPNPGDIHPLIEEQESVRISALLCSWTELPWHLPAAVLFPRPSSHSLCSIGKSSPSAHWHTRQMDFVASVFTINQVNLKSVCTSRIHPKPSSHSGGLCVCERSVWQKDTNRHTACETHLKCSSTFSYFSYQIFRVSLLKIHLLFKP